VALTGHSDLVLVTAHLVIPSCRCGGGEWGRVCVWGGGGGGGGGEGAGGKNTRQEAGADKEGHMSAIVAELTVEVGGGGTAQFSRCALA
jgi:hypothetical protein